MESERMAILDRLQAGEITVSQAQALLQALINRGEMPASPAHDHTPTTSPEDLAAAIHLEELPNPLHVQAPDLDRFRQRWRIPFAAGVTGVVLLGGLLVAMTRDAAGQVTLALVCTWPSFLGAVGLALLALWGRRARWVQVRVEGRDGRRLRLSAPVPVGLVGSVVTVVNWFVPSARGRLQNAGNLLTEMRQSNNHEPLLLDTHDETGVHVQIFVG